MSNAYKDSVTALTARVVSSYVGNHVLPSADLPNLIAKVHLALDGLGARAKVATPLDKPVPAVPIRKSIQDDYLISLEDGRKFKSLKRHLLTNYGMTPYEYRTKWGLPQNYPMVAPGYAAKRSELAKSFGLGRLRERSLAAQVQKKVTPEVTGNAPQKTGHQSAPVGRKSRSKTKGSAEAAE